jgi:mono/diheme cytochrome c family protein
VTDAHANPKLALGLLFACSVGFGGCAAKELVTPPSREGDRAIYLEACASCHGAGGTGDGPAADTLKHRPADLTRLAEQHGGEFPRQLLVDVVTGRREIPAHGDTEMPVWGHAFSQAGSGATVGAAIYTQRLINGVIQYLESIQVEQDSGR